MAGLDGYGIAIIAFLGLSLAVGTLTSRLVKKSSKRYMVAGKSLPLFFVGTMLAAQSVDGNSSLGNVSLVYQLGFWAGAAVPIGLASCLIITGVFYGKRLNKMSMLTLPDFYFRRFGAGSEGISSVILAVSFIILVAGNFAASGFIMSAVFGIDFFWAMLIAAIVVLIYTYAGGLFSSAYTDIFQIYLAIGAFIAAFLFFVWGFSGTPFNTILAAAPEGYLDLSGLTTLAGGGLVNWSGIINLALGDIVALDFMERVFSARNGKTAQRGAFMGAGLTISTIVPTSMMGIVAFFFIPSIADPFMVYPELAINHMPFAIGAALLMGILGASMSTANGGLLAISSVISRNLIQRDILKTWLKRPGLEDRKLLITTRIFTIPMMSAAFILAYLLPQPGVYLILAFDIVLAGAWAPLTLGLFWKKSNMPAAVTSLVVGTGIRLLMFFLIGGVIPIEYAGIETFIPPPISFALFVIVALATQKKYPGEKRHGVVDYVPPEEDIVKGEDLKGYVTPAGGKLE
jgi:SSS family solute:Na+ symporter